MLVRNGVRFDGLKKKAEVSKWGEALWCHPDTQLNRKADILSAIGARGQNIIVHPGEYLVIVTTAGNMRQPDKDELIYDLYLNN